MAEKTPVFDVWMRLMQNVPGVLWLLGDNAAAERNLRREAQARGIDPARLIFAPRLALDAHLARHRLADLFLDTLPINAHTTASDALWAGLPIVTCRGNSFVACVAASILCAAGLPELVTDNLAQYETCALRLATDQALLGSIRRRLEDNRACCPLFDIKRYTRHIEAAYTTMWEISRRGEAPRSFAVAAI
jgi:predicted O-linked N-acetylglucosamine transferase (SPINDLY family)